MTPDLRRVYKVNDFPEVAATLTKMERREEWRRRLELVQGRPCMWCGKRTLTPSSRPDHLSCLIEHGWG